MTTGKAPPRRWPRTLVGTFVRVPWREWLFNIVFAQLPPQLGAPYRARLYRLIGFRGIHPTVYIEGTLKFRGDGNVYRRLRIGPRSNLNGPCDIDLGGAVEIGAGVSVCHHVSIMTMTHEIGPAEFRAGAPRFLPVRIEDGVWVGAHVVICAGVTVGRGSVLVPGSVITRDVPPNAVVQGSPARVVRWLDRPAPADAAPGDTEAAGGTASADGHRPDAARNAAGPRGLARPDVQGDWRDGRL
jgi:maltose O-acetyltransferase